MCELFALCARKPTTLRLSLEELMRHGGETDHHRDGWGVAHFFPDGDARILREPAPAASSPLARFLLDHQVSSSLVVSHIRRATAGSVTFANTHPFDRELGGRRHVFAHNGHLRNVKEQLSLGAFQPIGDTDSEHAFCALLDELTPVWRRGSPTVEERRSVVERFASVLRDIGVANFLYTDGELLFAHGHRRPRTNDDEPPRPGLHLLERACDIDHDAVGLDLRDGRQDQRLCLVATVPLSDEAWRPLDVEGELCIFRAGEPTTR